MLKKFYFLFYKGGGGGRQGWGDGGLGVLQHQVHLIQEKKLIGV